MAQPTTTTATRALPQLRPPTPPRTTLQPVMARPDTTAHTYPIIEATILRTPGISRARLVGVLTENGVSESTAYRHITKYFRSLRARRHLPEQQEVLIRVTGALEAGIDQVIHDGRKGNVGGMARLLLEAHGLLAPADVEPEDESERLARAADALARLRGYLPDGGDGGIGLTADERQDRTGPEDGDRTEDGTDGGAGEG